jgi:putative sigma-54 modulation protein
MNIHITLHHLTLTPALRDFTTRKIAGLGEMVPDIVAARVVLRLDPKASPERRFSARVRLAVRGMDIFASDNNGDLYAAIDNLVDKLARGLRKRKTRLLPRRQLRHARLVSLTPAHALS